MGELGVIWVIFGVVSECGLSDMGETRPGERIRLARVNFWAWGELGIDLFDKGISVFLHEVGYDRRDWERERLAAPGLSGLSGGVVKEQHQERRLCKGGSRRRCWWRDLIRLELYILTRI